MAKKNPKSVERREMVEKMRQEQARKERARSLGILGACVLVVLALIGTAATVAIKDHNAQAARDKKAIGKLGKAASAAGCNPILTKKTDMTQEHVPTGPIQYADAPPSFGKHRPQPAAFGRTFYTSDRPEVATLVHNLEHGYVIAWYDDTAAKDKSEMDDLKTIGDKFTKAQERFIAAPWHPSDGAAFPSGKHIALTRWSADAGNPSDETKQRGNWQYCSSVSGSVISSFLNKWPNNESPEPGLF
ncbi:MAG: DUF3105 domain-containing protein [Marmoricola sp.]